MRAWLPLAGHGEEPTVADHDLERLRAPRAHDAWLGDRRPELCATPGSPRAEGPAA